MSSEHLASAQTELKGDLGASWNILDGASANYTDLGVARRFGGSAAAYSLRDIGSMNGPVVNVRRSPHDAGDADGPGGSADTSPNDETDFSANQVQNGGLEDWVNGKLESTLPADVATSAAAYSLRKVKEDYNLPGIRIRRIDNTEVDVNFDSNDKISTSSSILNVSSGDVDNTSETTLGNFLQGEADVRALFNNASYNPTSSDNNGWSPSSDLDLGSGVASWSCDFVITGEFGSTTSRLFQNTAGTIFFYWETSTRLRYQIDSSEGQTPIDSTVTIQKGRKYNMEWSRDASNNTTLKIDGVTVGTNTTTARNTGQITAGRIAGNRLEGVALNWNFNNGQHIYAGDGVEASNWVDTGTGGSDLSKQGSPVAFTGQGIDSFVDIWYDQAGSKNAVQDSATNQPKIAEDGALLADGIKFDGSTTSLATGTQVLTANETGSQSIYAVCNVTDGASGYIAGSADDDSSGKIGQSIYYYTTTDVFALTNGSTATNTTVDRISAIVSSNVLVSFNYSNNAANTLNQNANQNGYSDGTDAYDFEAGSNFVIGARGGTVQAGRAVNGSIQEVIAYTSDQSNNRFKIESNINNYYGLYNDANELSAAFDSNGTITNASKDGFTADVATFSHYVNATFNNSVATGETIYVSFNAQLAPNGGTAASPSLRLQNAQVGTNTSNQSSISEGFNSVPLTATGTSDRVGFLEQDDNVDYIISDFKVSRIARNGFVETWYDQSGNGRDITQGTAGDQPAIVRNGGQVKSENSLPSISFSDDAVTLEREEFLSGQLSSYFLIYDAEAADSGEAQVVFRQGTNYRLSAAVQTDGNIRGQIRDAGGDALNLDSGGDLATGGTILQSIFIRARGADGFINYAQGANEVKGDSTDVEDTNFAAADTGDFAIGANPSGPFDFKGEIQEAIFFNSDLFTDKSTIETELNNHYNAF